MKFVLATGNPGKLKELKTILNNSDYEITSQADYGVCDADECGLSFIENALIKARHASQHSGLSAIADDSGLEVDYLDGQPGIHSARYAGESATDQKNIDKLLTALNGVPTDLRTARFHCVIATVKTEKDSTPIICHGIWEGRITEFPCGNNGFGYDPIFYIPELGCTSAELSSAIKNKHSHRAKALQQLREQLL